MQIVIKIPDWAYDNLPKIHNGSMASKALLEYVKNGTPLPAWHGRLSDMDELVKKIVNEYGVNSIHELPQDIKAFYEKFIKPAPTVLDATFDYKLKNYACVKGVEE